MNDENKNQFNGLTCLWMAAALAVGAGLALTFSSWIFEKAPSDLRRIGVLLDVLEENTLQPSYVVMGNSVVMSGIDARLLSTKLPGRPLGLNLATTGQNPVDSYLYYQNLPESVELVLQFTLPRFAAGKDSVEPQKYNAMYMYGYRPNTTTKSRLNEIFTGDTRSVLDMSDLGQRFASRWALQQTADNLVRSIVRKDLQFDSYTFDLYFPKTGAIRLPDAQMERDLNIRYPGSFDHSFSPATIKYPFYREAGSRVAELGKTFALVISPLHPNVHVRYGDEWYSQVRKYFHSLGEAGNFAVIDATDSVSGADYVDALHLSESGAQALTDFVAGEIRRLNLEPQG